MYIYSSLCKLSYDYNLEGVRDAFAKLPIDQPAINLHFYFTVQYFAMDDMDLAVAGNG